MGKSRRGTIYIRQRRAGVVPGSRQPQNCRCGAWVMRGGACARCTSLIRTALVMMALALGLLVARGMV